MTITEAAERWARTWEQGWNERDVEAIVDLYSDDVVYTAEPSRLPYRGRQGIREFVSRAFDEEERVTAVFGRPIVGDEGASVAWWAAMLENGEETTLAGTSSLRFDADGRVVDQWDSWNQAPGLLPVSGWLFEGRK